MHTHRKLWKSWSQWTTGNCIHYGLVKFNIVDETQATLVDFKRNIKPKMKTTA